MNIFYRIKVIIKENKNIFQNMSYITILQIFVMLIPLATYPYLIRVLGKELFGYVITAEVVAKYSSIFVNFGFRYVSARFVSIHRDNKKKLSDILSSVLIVRTLIWLMVFCLYVGILLMVPKYKEYYLLFVLSYGLTFNELLFPQFFFQGIEKMKYITILNVLIRLFFLVCIFVFIREPEDFYMVPVFMSLGFLLSGIFSFILIKRKEGVVLKIPTIATIRELINDSLPVFLKDLISSIKDKLNYILIGSFVGMDSVVIYDLGTKFVKLLVKPGQIIGTVLFPVISKTKDAGLFIKGAKSIFLITLLSTLICYIFLPEIVSFFIPGNISLLPLKYYLTVPVILSLSSFIASNYMIAFGMSRYVLYSMIITVISYVGILSYFYLRNDIANITNFIIIAMFSYFTEFIYRIYIFLKKNRSLNFKLRIFLF